VLLANDPITAREFQYDKLALEIVRRGVIQVDTDPPVALAHDRRRVQEQGKAQGSHVAQNWLFGVRSSRRPTQLSAAPSRQGDCG